MLLQKILMVFINFLVKKNDKFKKVDINEFVYNPMNLTLGALDLNNNKITISVSGYYVVMKNKDVEKFDNDFLKILLKTTYAIYQYNCTLKTFEQ